jgi:hypothetical protein
MFRDVPPRDPHVPPQTAIPAAFDWSARLSIDMIRSHTKTDDTPTVDNAQIDLYREAAIEAAEKYTALLLRGQQTIMEPIQSSVAPRHDRAAHLYGFIAKPTYKHTLRYSVADGLVYLYGSVRHTFHVPPGSRTIHVPVVTGYLDLSNCCDPCASHHMNAGLMAMYLAGFSCPDAVPSGVVVGCLQFIAWCIEHPGDMLVTVMNKARLSSSGVQGTNNIALASGALEQWRLYDNEAL